MTVQMAAQGVRFPQQCAHLALQTVHVQDPWPDTLVTTVRRLPSPPKEQGSPLCHLVHSTALQNTDRLRYPGSRGHPTIMLAQAWDFREADPPANDVLQLHAPESLG